MKDALLIICEILFFSLVLNIVLKKFEILPLIGYIITGIVAGTFFGMENSDILEQIAQFGIVLSKNSPSLTKKSFTEKWRIWTDLARR